MLRTWAHHLVSVAFKGKENRVRVQRGRKTWAGWWLNCAQETKRPSLGDLFFTSDSHAG